MNIIFIGLVSIIILLFFCLRIRQRAIQDANTDYSAIELHYKIDKLLTGETILIFAYNRLTEMNKKKYILETIKQGLIFEHEHEFKYIVSELLTESGKSDNKSFKRVNDTIIYKLISQSEKPEKKTVRKNYKIKPNNTFGDNNVFINTESGIVNQTVKCDTFSSLICEYKFKMVKQGIPQKDIENIINNSDNYTKQSFLSKYKFELSKIFFDAVNLGITLYDKLSELLK